MTWVSKYSISLMKIVRKHNTKPTASKKMKVINKIKGTYNIYQVGLTPKIVRKMKMTTRPNKKFINCVIVKDKGKIVFGKYTWLIIELYLRIEFDEEFIDELIQRSEESRVGKEGRWRWGREKYKRRRRRG